MIEKIKNSIYNFMRGRYGLDILGKRLNLLFLILIVLSILLKLMEINTPWLGVLALLTLIVLYYRILSKNYPPRMKENEAYKNFEAKISMPFIRLKRFVFGTKTHVYTRCPSCKAEIRIPKGKGKLKVTCPKCKHIFIKKDLVKKKLTTKIKSIIMY